MGQVATFQILFNGKVKPITKEQYLKRLGKKGYTVGYTDGSWILFARNGEVITTTSQKLEEIFELPKEIELP
jgi:hypothetical protein